jgi:hypothetical protein
MLLLPCPLSDVQMLFSCDSEYPASWTGCQWHHCTTNEMVSHPNSETEKRRLLLGMPVHFLHLPLYISVHNRPSTNTSLHHLVYQPYHVHCLMCRCFSLVIEYPASWTGYQWHHCTTDEMASHSSSETEKWRLLLGMPVRFLHLPLYITGLRQIHLCIV